MNPSTTRFWARRCACGRKNATPPRLARFDGIGALDSFRRATASSRGNLPGEALAWDGVARAESSLGEIGRAAEAARRAGALIAGHADAPPIGKTDQDIRSAVTAELPKDAADPKTKLEGLKRIARS